MRYKVLWTNLYSSKYFPSNQMTDSSSLHFFSYKVTLKIKLSTIWRAQQLQELHRRPQCKATFSLSQSGMVLHKDHHEEIWKTVELLGHQPSVTKIKIKGINNYSFWRETVTLNKSVTKKKWTVLYIQLDSLSITIFVFKMEVGKARSEEKLQELKKKVSHDCLGRKGAF